MIIVDPHTLITTTSIIKSVPCTRKAFLSEQFAGSCGASYPQVLGRVIHAFFEEILSKLDSMQPQSQIDYDSIRKNAIKDEILWLYTLGKSEEEVEIDTRKAAANITKWIDQVLMQHTGNRLIALE